MRGHAVSGRHGFGRCYSSMHVDGMSLDEVRLRMLDVAHAIQLESQAILSEKRNLNERGKGHKA